MDRQEEQAGLRSSQTTLTTKTKKGRWQHLPSLYYIFADGSSSHITQDGGWAYIVVNSESDIINEDSGYVNPATNNAMELKAIIEGLKSIKKSSSIKVFSDSAYVINTMSNQWWKEWQQNKWIKKTGEVTPNAELWKELIHLSDYHDVEYIKVRGHNGDEFNERCDKMAKSARKRTKNNWKDL